MNFFALALKYGPLAFDLLRQYGPVLQEVIEALSPVVQRAVANDVPHADKVQAVLGQASDVISGLVPEAQTAARTEVSGA